MSPLLLVGLVSSVFASERVDWRLWSWSGVEARPDYHGDTELRAEQQLGLYLHGEPGWSVDAVGSVHDPQARSPLGGDLYRLAFGLERSTWSASAGRIVVGGERGFLRLDGASVEAGLPGPLALRAWGGRVWHAETWEVQDLTLLGGELRLEPGGFASGGAGWEGRLEYGEIVHRVHAFARVRTVQGAWGSLIAEAAPLEEPNEGSLMPARIALAGNSHMNQQLDLGGDLRWEGLDPAVEAEALRSPMDWLAGPGYLAAEGRARWQLEDLTLYAYGGPTLRVGQASPLGGSARLGGSLALGEQASVGLAAVGAQASPSWLLGSVVEARVVPIERVAVRAEAGWFRFAPQAGPHANVWEGRLAADAPLLHREVADLSLSAELAAGADRLLDPWLRAGLALRGTMGRGRTP
jgi:hypothetical protein